MNVKQLIARLQKLPGDLDVYVATDGEGNGYGLLNADCIEAGNKLLVLYPGYPQIDELPEDEE